jgi:hypothetical protein
MKFIKIKSFLETFEKRRFVEEPYNKKVVTERRTTSSCGWVEVVETNPQLQMWVELSREKSKQSS